MLSKIFRSVLVFLLLFSCKANSKPTDFEFLKHSDRHDRLAEVPKPGNNIHGFFEILGVARVSAQSVKTVQVLKYTVLSGQGQVLSTACTIFKQGGFFDVHSLFRKRILFPFHAFW